MVTKITGFLGQQLNVGDEVILMLRSGTHYLAQAKIHSIDLSGRRPVVKVIRKANRVRWKYIDGKWTKVDLGEVEYIKRIYSWDTAITIKASEA